MAWQEVEGSYILNEGNLIIANADIVAFLFKLVYTYSLI